MKALEEYYGVRLKRRMPIMQLLQQKESKLTRERLKYTLKEVNNLFARGYHDQCFELLEKAVRLVPNDPRPFYLLALIHEEMGNVEKAHTAYLICALLKKNSTTLWKKVRYLSAHLNDKKTQILALERIYTREPSAELLRERQDCCRKTGRKHLEICCTIDLFDYDGVSEKIFKKLEKVMHQEALQRICKRLIKTIEKHTDGQKESFVRKTLLTLYKINDWENICYIYEKYYTKGASQGIDILYLIARAGSRKEEHLASECNEVISGLQSLEGLCEYFSKIVDIFVENQKYSEGKKIMKHLTERCNDVNHKLRLGDILEMSGDLLGSIRIHQEILSKEPTNLDARAKIHDLYIKIGETELAGDYKVSSEIHSYALATTNLKKSEYRFSTTLCDHMRSIYNEAMSDLCHENRDSFLEKSAFLLKDFFANAFVRLDSKSFKSFREKNEKVSLIDTSIILYDKNVSQKQAAQNIIRLSSLHGLDVPDWLNLIVNTIHCYNCSFKYSEAHKLAKKAVNVHLFGTQNTLMFLSLLSLRTAIHEGDFNWIVDLSKRLSIAYDTSSAYLLYFFCSFIPEFYTNEKFHEFQRSLQRIYKKGIIGKNMNDIEGETESDDFSSMSSEDKEIDQRVDDFLGANSYLPRYHFTPTVNFIAELTNPIDIKTKCLTGIICLTHTRSRAVFNKMKYAKKGMEILSSIEGESAIKIFNLAKGYHFFGYLGQAEKLYSQILGKYSGEVARMAAYNLILIYRKNKSKAFFIDWLNRVSKLWLT